MKVTDNFVFFWGARDIFSNFHSTPFEHEGQTFKWSEQAVMYRKAMLFGATDIAESILRATTPKKCKELGRSRRIAFDEKVWVKHRERIYKEVLIDKFSVPRYKKQLLKTGDKHIVESSPYDKIWGIGLKDDHPDAEKPDKWKGLNLLGKVLMEVRDELK